MISKIERAFKMKFYRKKGWDNHSDYTIHPETRKWFGFCGKYRVSGFIRWTGSFYFVNLKIIDLNWRSRDGDKHWYILKRHQPTIQSAKRWTIQMAKEPINYFEEIWK